MHSTIFYNCTFIYKPFNGGLSSPIPLGVNLISFYQVSNYGEDTASAIVNGIQVFNSINEGLGGLINSIVIFQVAGGVAANQKPIMSLSNVSVNKNAINYIATTGFEATTKGLVKLDNIVVPSIAVAAVATNGNDSNMNVVATNILNLEALSNPANKKHFVKNTVGGTVVYGGKLSGFNNQGFLNSYQNGTNVDKHPSLMDASLSSANGYGGQASIQSVSIADEASFAFDRRFINASRGLFLVSVDFDFNTQGLFATGGTQVHIIAAVAGSLFSASTTGANLDTPSRLNIWWENGVINVKNRLGASYNVTIMFMG